MTRSRSQTPRRHATAQSFAPRIAGRCPFDSPLRSFERHGSMPPGSPASFPGWNRYLEAAFHSPETTARLQATISRSKLPTCSFDTLPFVRRARSDSDSLTRSGSPRRAQDHYRNPVARLPSATPNPSSDLHSPAGPLGPLRIKAFNPIPGREVHLPSAPDCPSLPGIVSILLVRYQITAPSSLSVQWLAVPQTSWNLCHHAPSAMLQSNEKSISKRFSSNFIWFRFIRLAETKSVLPVDKTINYSCVSLYKRSRPIESYSYEDEGTFAMSHVVSASLRRTTRCRRRSRRANFLGGLAARTASRPRYRSDRRRHSILRVASVHRAAIGIFTELRPELLIDRMP